MRARLALVASLACASCVSTHRASVAPAPLQLRSVQPFRAHVAATDSTTAATCTMTAALGFVRAIRGDTLEFAALSAVRRPSDQPDCTRGRPATVIVSESPQLTSVVVQPNHARSAVAFVMLALTTGGLLFLYAMLSGMS